MYAYKTILTLLSITLITSGRAKAEQATNSVNMSIDFNAQTCMQSNFGTSCSIGLTQNILRTISLDPLYDGCVNPQPPPIGEVPGSHSFNSTPFQAADNNNTTPWPINSCEPRNWRGHWIDLLYTNNMRFVGIVTVEKSLLSMSSQPNQDITWYVVTVEIMDMKKTVAKMSTRFASWDQLPSATLESVPIEKDYMTTTITLNIGEALELIIAPPGSTKPIPDNPVESPTPSALTSKLNAKASWQVSIGQLANK